MATCVPPGANVGLINSITKKPFIKGEYLSTRDDDGIATVKMAWKLADGKPAMAYTHQGNVVAVKTSQPGVQSGSTVGLINSITKTPTAMSQQQSTPAPTEAQLQMRSKQSRL